MNPGVPTSRRASRAFAAPCALSITLHASALLVCTTLPWGAIGSGARAEGDGDGFTLRLGRATVLAAAAAAELDAPAALEIATPVAQPIAPELAAQSAPPELIAAPLVDVERTETSPLAAENAPVDAPLEPRAAEHAPPLVQLETALAPHASVAPETPQELLPGVGNTAQKPEVAVGTSGELVFAAAAAELSPARGSASAPSAPALADVRATPDANARASAATASPSGSAPGASANGAAAELPGSGGGDHGPKLIASPRPVYPHESELHGEYGKVLCALFIDARGVVERVEVLRSSGFARLDRAASVGLARWRFEPAVENGRPIASQFRHTVSFVFE